jgi:hypothetical protein
VFTEEGGFICRLSVKKFTVYTYMPALSRYHSRNNMGYNVQDIDDRHQKAKRMHSWIVSLLYFSDVKKKIIYITAREMSQHI